jgi:peptidoglycan/xylan/chitin deacetylase (PgdA/CDA1 family)
MRAKRLVLTYHSHNISGDKYHDNDHVALEADLATLSSSHARIVSLHSIARAHKARHWPNDDSLQVAITFDDGPRFDFSDFMHRDFGSQKSFLRNLTESMAAFGNHATDVCATSFVIASPEARAQMERSADCGFSDLTCWLGDDWWSDAAKSQLLSIGNHSWDHVHPAVRRIAQREHIRGDFSKIADYADADAQVRASSEYILSKLPNVSSLPFAYPSGQVSKYLCDEYFPQYQAMHRCYAAFSTAGRRIDPDDTVWALPRFVCGWHWHSTEEFAALLRR